MYSLKAVGRALCLITHHNSDLLRLESAGSIVIGLPLLFLEIKKKIILIRINKRIKGKRK